MLLSRSPLSPGPKSRIPFDLHVSDVPPAFILSQDQTLLRFKGFLKRMLQERSFNPNVVFSQFPAFKVRRATAHKRAPFAQPL